MKSVIITLLSLLLLPLPVWAGGNVYAPLGPYTSFAFSPSPGYGASTEKWGYGGRWEQERTGASGIAEVISATANGTTAVLGTIKAQQTYQYQAETERLRLLLEKKELEIRNVREELKDLKELQEILLQEIKWLQKAYEKLEKEKIGSSG